ncbi:hypothetical protein LINGRAHAP2_LOCUS19446 [Linum grandiflorum]
MEVSPSARYDTPIPPDLAYVPPVPTAVHPSADVAPSASIPVPGACSTPAKSHQVLPADQPQIPDVTEVEKSQILHGKD